MKHFYLILGLFSALFITSCTKEPVIDIPLPTPNDNAIVRTNITEKREGWKEQRQKRRKKECIGT